MVEKSVVVKKKQSLAMRQHVALFDGEGWYLRWCEANHFAVTCDKSAKEIRAEAEIFYQQQIRLKEHARLHRQPKQLLADICHGRLQASEIKRAPWHELAVVIEARKLTADQRLSLLDFYLHILQVSDFLLETTEFEGREVYYFVALLNLHEKKKFWMRKLADWRPASHNAARQFRSLLHHLLVRYDMPKFFERVWFVSDTEHERYRDWYIHLGNGGNIRQMETPVPLTKMMAHHMMQAPDHYSVQAALRWGQIRALGGDRDLVEAVMATALVRDFAHDEFWLSVFRFFVDSPQLDLRHVGPIVDFLWTQKITPRRILTADRWVEHLPPAQPNLNMKGRTVPSLLKQIEAWHEELRRERIALNNHFMPSGFKAFIMETYEGEAWVISELLSTAALREEGRQMRHCVLSYADDCIEGHCSIWAMAVKHKGVTEKRLTIEVSRAGFIVQCRGKLNRLASAAEFSIVQRWARYAGLIIASHVKPQA